MPAFIKKPIQIEAVRLCWANWNEVCDFVGDAINPENPAFEIEAHEVSDTCGEPGPMYIAFWAQTMHGEKALFRHGDWIIPDAKEGTFYPCDPKVFAATYDPVGE